jgi:hypothetical protein
VGEVSVRRACIRALVFLHITNRTLITCTYVVPTLPGLIASVSELKGPDKNTKCCRKNALSEYLNRRIFLASPGLFLQNLEVV